MSDESESKPLINVTPLIDILLVLLIIFMAISPLKPARFEAKIPAESKSQADIPAPADTLVVTVNADSSLNLNQEADLGTIADPGKLIARLAETFQMRLENRVYAEETGQRSDLPEDDKIQKTVFLKAPRSLPYGEVARVVDAVKSAGARPIALQIDGLQ